MNILNEKNLFFALRKFQVIETKKNLKKCYFCKVCNFSHEWLLLLLILLVKKPSFPTVFELITLHLTQAYHNILLQMCGP
jgi:hypothetical protein